MGANHARTSPASRCRAGRGGRRRSATGLGGAGEDVSGMAATIDERRSCPSTWRSSPCRPHTMSSVAVRLAGPGSTCSSRSRSPGRRGARRDRRGRRRPASCSPSATSSASTPPSPSSPSCSIDPIHIEATRVSPYAHGIGDGVIFDLMIHDLDIVVALAGDDASVVDARGSLAPSGARRRTWPR